MTTRESPSAPRSHEAQSVPPPLKYLGAINSSTRNKVTVGGKVRESLAIQLNRTTRVSMPGIAPGIGRRTGTICSWPIASSVSRLGQRWLSGTAEHRSFLRSAVKNMHRGKKR